MPWGPRDGGVEKTGVVRRNPADIALQPMGGWADLQNGLRVVPPLKKKKSDHLHLWLLGKRGHLPKGHFWRPQRKGGAEVKGGSMRRRRCPPGETQSQWGGGTGESGIAGCDDEAAGNELSIRWSEPGQAKREEGKKRPG